ncbi:MAG TPA: iron ABC transporter permease [Ktedonobacterales bacterium]
MVKTDERVGGSADMAPSDVAAAVAGAGDDATRPDGAADSRAQLLRLNALPLLALLLAASVVLAASIGAVAIPPGTTLAVLLNATHLFHFHRAWPLSDQVILLQLRLPRVVGAAIAGAALAVAGALFQGLLRNPLADPFLLGTSAGAALGATVAFVVPALFVASWLGFSLLAICAFAGALLSAALVYAIATRGRQTPVVTLLLAGVAVSAILTAAQTLVLALHERAGFQLLGFYYWLAGSIDVQSWAQIGVLLPLTLAGVAAAILAAPALDAFALGEEMAEHLGLSVERAKLLIAALAALLVAAAVSISGLVGFVGLVAPHVCRITLGPQHRLLIPASALVGAIFVVLADLAARTLAAPSELPLGVITALAGGPFFLYLLRAAGRGYRW